MSESAPQIEQNAESSVEDLQESLAALSIEVTEMKEELQGYHNRDLTRAEFDTTNQLAYELTMQEKEVAKVQGNINALRSAMPSTPPEGYPSPVHIPEAANENHPPRSVAV